MRRIAPQWLQSHLVGAIKTSHPIDEAIRGDEGEESSDEEKGQQREGVFRWIRNITGGKSRFDDVCCNLMEIAQGTKFRCSKIGSTKFETNNHICEVYSPPRVVARAPRHGLRSGFSFDPTNKTDEGEEWHLSKAQKGQLDKVKQIN